ncbi:hypothetical protein [Methylobacterium platani]|uniref:Uncharacterized protein n=2 Tax=Methylobacterium platani TaxID=427683 RepID=A0A179SDP6_9HYPH|nr:hypothetical protein [Methylobacterium platani]KMO20711.1 hypothetical protein SQ03_05010 [Methylobacterium platani JCM 14648]OAS25981.1 hypothetical protein A5481_07400 [Methylobacterium platani]
MIPAADRFGPWRDGLSDAERLARLRCMRTVSHLILGPRGEAFAGALRQAESDPDHLPIALRALDALAPIERRQVLCSFARIHQSAA